MGSDPGSTPPLTPAAKRALLDAHRQAQASRVDARDGKLTFHTESRPTSDAATGPPAQPAQAPGR